MIYFRADANSIIGSGHIMRCLAIASEFEKQNKKCCFLTSDDNADSMIDRFNIKHYCLNSKWNDLDGEIDTLVDYLKNNDAEILIVDHYSVTKNYFSRLKGICKLVYIDDLDKSVYPVDVLINYNIYAERMNYRKEYPSDTKLLLGPKYVPLRREFQNLPTKNIKDKVEDVLISTGGSDPVGVGKELLLAIKKDSTLSNIKFHFVLGALNKQRDEILELSKDTDNIIIHENVKRMDLLMQKCDLAISAAGGTLYELCACGVPTITYILADNQIMGAKAFSELELMINSGDIRLNNKLIKEIINNLLKIKDDSSKRREISVRCSKSVDGNGKAYIVSILM